MGSFGKRSLVLLAVTLFLVGCGRESDDVPETAKDSPSEVRPESSLEISVTTVAGEGPTSWTLTCDPPGGTHPDPEGACQAIDTAKRPFAPVPADMMCTQIYGGPEVATITGTWRGEPVDASYKRTDGCEIARWKAIQPVLAPVSTG